MVTNANDIGRIYFEDLNKKLYKNNQDTDRILYRSFKCPYRSEYYKISAVNWRVQADCAFEGKNKNVLNHNIECIFRPIKCLRCEEIFPKIMWKDHLNTCSGIQCKDCEGRHMKGINDKEECILYLKKNYEGKLEKYITYFQNKIKNINKENNDDLQINNYLSKKEITEHNNTICLMNNNKSSKSEIEKINNENASKIKSLITKHDNELQQDNNLSTSEIEQINNENTNQILNLIAEHSFELQKHYNLTTYEQEKKNNENAENLITEHCKELQKQNNLYKKEIGKINNENANKINSLITKHNNELQKNNDLSNSEIDKINNEYNIKLKKATCVCIVFILICTISYFDKINKINYKN